MDMKLKPVGHSDLKTGGEYLQIRVRMDHSMILMHMRVLREPYARPLLGAYKDWWILAEETSLTPGVILVQEEGHSGGIGEPKNLTDIGCPVPPEYCYSLNRTFHDTPQTRAMLIKLVATQNLREYLRFIDRGSSDESVGRILAEARAMPRLTYKGDGLGDFISK